MRVVFFIKALSSKGGGAERVLVDVASGLARRGHQVTVVTSDAIGSVPYYPLHPLVSQVNLAIGKVSSMTSFLDIIRRAFAARRFVAESKPDIVIGFMNSTYVLLSFAMSGLGVRLIASEHIGYEYYKIHSFQLLLNRLALFNISKIIVVSEQSKQNFPSSVREKMLTISNPVGFGTGRRAELRGKPQVPKVLLSVGRLDEQKNHKDLIAAFGLIASSVTDWDLHIIGEGPLRAKLEQQISDMKLGERVKLCGDVKNIDGEYLNAQLFALPSLYESFGLVVAEALVHGLPVVGFADCSGINQLIRHDENGLLVEAGDRVGNLANVLKSLMLNPDERCRLGSASAEWVVEKYNIETILDSWEKLLLA